MLLTAVFHATNFKLTAYFVTPMTPHVASRNTT